MKAILLFAAISPIAFADDPASNPRRPSPPIDFAREIRPILQRHCWECHGPAKREGGLRLDSRENALRGGDGGPALQPGRAIESELYQRIGLPADDPDAMPARGDRLAPAQIALIREWIDQGASWPESPAAAHWSYVKPVRPSSPDIGDSAWPRQPIDRFVLARLRREGLEPAPEAERSALIRRVSLDLIGLPPSPAEVGAFLNDQAPNAYETLVDRLLASRHYGERWARPWLDLARYADSHGFQRDDLRSIWPYRDWVIKALNDDMPFDRFTIEQIAGDLPPDSTLDQKIAAGFHRCAAINVEAGSEPEETRVNQVFDRVNVTAAVWLGSTFECAQCHDHKYDPFTQNDYYRLFAFFNNTASEAERAKPDVPGSIRFLGPYLELPGILAPAPAPSSPAASSPPAEAKPKAKATAKAKAKAKAEAKAEPKPLTTLAMRELPEPRETRILQRGDWRSPGAAVQPGVPAILHPMPPGPGNRLTLARWLVDRENPLVARVTVNRLWGELFGQGIVSTAEDFGVKGEPPSHPELLDWLAVEFMDRGWSMKAALRTIVLSSTYRQSSRVTPLLRDRDPRNILYARGPRFRMDAEMIRDNALTIAGLLSRKAFGPPIYPEQPPGLWEKIGGDKVDYVVSPGEDRHRRGIYVVWKRSAPYPSFANFDATPRLTCAVKRSRTNTPLQALTLLNDPVHAEAAAEFGRRIVRETPGADFDARVRHAFRLCLARDPSQAERAALRGFVDDRGTTPEEEAWRLIAVVLLNLDETITKG